MEANRRAHSPAHSEPYSSDARWMTFAELALIRGTSKRAAVTLVRRHGWRRQRNNEGHVIALVPLTWASPEQGNKEPHKDPDNQSISEPHNGAHAAGFETALTAIQAAHANEVAALRERVNAAEESRVAAQVLADRILAQLTEASSRAEKAEKRADAADADRRTAEVRADRAEQAIAGELSRADALRDRLEAVQSQLATAEAESKAAHERAWASGEQLAEAERRAAADRERADRVEARAAHEREDFLDAEARTRRELETVRERVEAAEGAAELARQRAAEATEARRQADEARKARGRLARLRAAWRGE